MRKVVFCEVGTVDYKDLNPYNHIVCAESNGLFKDKYLLISNGSGSFSWLDLDSNVHCDTQMSFEEVIEEMKSNNKHREYYVFYSFSELVSFFK